MIQGSQTGAEVSRDKQLVFGTGSFQNDRIYVSTPATIYHIPATAKKSAVYAAGDGSVWSDAITTYKNMEQRPALTMVTNSTL